MDLQALARRIDHTLLKPGASREEVKQVLREGLEWNFNCVYIPPAALSYLEEFRARLGQLPPIGTVADFPLGHLPLDVKLREVRALLSFPIKSLDFVVNLAELRARNYQYVLQEVVIISELCRSSGVTSKCIVETGYLPPDQRVEVYERICFSPRPPDYIKTCTGFGPEGARLEDVAAWSASGGPNGVKIKASGGIRDVNAALAFIRAGANLIGTSNGVKMLEEYSEQQAAYTEGEETT